ncbi:MAG: hypothetical protein HKN72_03085 [Gemmatimonadetes bacterium]|nr:hypothetical protein [Gemmatimonadota bacterium]
MTMVVVAGLASQTLSPSPVAAQEYTELSRTEEIRLAMSAGPLSVSKEADVYVLGSRGFEKAVEGTNGFSCMVIRSAADRTILAPHCFSPDASATVLPGKLAEGRLQMGGMSQSEVEAELTKAFEDGSLPLPEGDAYAYMLSAGQHLGPAGQWRPHFMLYMPYATNEDVGGSPATPAFPFVGPEIGHPHSTMVIVMTEFVDPADVVLPR